MALKVLIAEDDPTTSAYEHLLVSSLGFEVVGIVFSGQAAVAQARIAHPDVILMDIMLADPMSGLEAANLIRHELGTPVVFASVLDIPATKEPVKPPRGVRFLRKPFTLEELADALNSVVERL